MTTAEMSSCPACQVIDRFDGIEDGQIARIEHFRSRDERSLFRTMIRAQGQVADRVTNFAGSMKFVYLHVGWFIFWIALNVGLTGVRHQFDKFPFGLLTMIVSLEAIFLSTFVMISQNRQGARSDVRSQLDFETNIRSEIWSVHIGQALGIDAMHVEQIVAQAVQSSARHLESASDQ